MEHFVIQNTIIINDNLQICTNVTTPNIANPVLWHPKHSPSCESRPMHQIVLRGSKSKAKRSRERYTYIAPAAADAVMKMRCTADDMFRPPFLCVYVMCVCVCAVVCSGRKRSERSWVVRLKATGWYWRSDGVAICEAPLISVSQSARRSQTGRVHSNVFTQNRSYIAHGSWDPKKIFE